MKEKTLNVEELVLAPETTKSASINVEESLNDEKYAFLISYTPNYKDLLVTQLHSIGCLIKNTSDEFNAIIIKGTMAQLEVLKGLDYVERVEINTTNTFEESSIIAKQMSLMEEGNNVNMKTLEGAIHSYDNSVQMSVDNPDVSVMATANGSTMSTAISLTVANWKNGTIDCPYDQKWYKVTANASDAHIGNAKGEYTIYTSGSLDTIGILYDSNGNQIAYSDDLYGNLNFSITEQLTYGETYYVKVTAYSSNTGNFRIVVGYTIASEFMPGATPISLNNWKAGEISCPGDEVWYKLNFNSSSDMYHIYTKGSLDTMGELYDNYGNLLASNDDAFGSTNFGISACLNKGNAYYICVKAYSSNTGSYQLIVTNNIAVESVRITNRIDSIDIGKTKELNVEVLPYHATNKSVVWSSSNTDIATIGTYTGKVSALSEGTTIIQASSASGGCADSFILQVKKEFVTIKRDEDNPTFNKMIFETSNKIWYCMDLDMIFNESNHTGMKLERADLNVWDECGNLRQYSSEEMKLIYAIDPHGFAYYVKERADELSSLSDILNYKDQIFQLLYQRQPKYFFRDIDGTWYSISKSNVEGSLSSYMSESELIFGTHPVYDISTLYVFVDLIVNTISNLVFSGVVDDIIDTIEDISKLYNLISSVGEYKLKNATPSSEIDGTDLSWIGSVIDIYTTLNNLAENLSSTPNCYLEIFDYCINDTNYDVYIKAANGELIQLKQLHNVMEQLYNS